MKGLFLISTFLLFYIIDFGQNTNALDEKFGFRDAKLEMPFYTFSNLEKAFIADKSNHMYQEFYSPKYFDKKIGDYELCDIIYYFYENKLLQIDIIICGERDNRYGVLQVLEKAYGKELYWCMAKKVGMSYSGLDKAVSIISITSIDYMAKYHQDEDQRLTDASKDL